MELSELKFGPHYTDRKRDRVANISNILVPKEALENFTLDQIKQPLIDLIKKEVNSRLERLEKQDKLASDNYAVGYRFFTPVIKTSEGKEYNITIIAPPSAEDIEKGKSKDNTGNYYYLMIYDNFIATLILSSSPDLSKDIQNHLDRKYKDKPLKVLDPPGAKYTINLNSLMGIETPESAPKIKEEDLPYKVRTDYRIGSKFEHKDYGIGKVVATSSGNKGTGDSRGIISWVEVDFGKSYLSGGKLQKTRKLSNIYTSVYFGKTLDENNDNSPVNVNYYQRILDISNGLSISQRKYLQGMLDTIRLKDGMVTDRQREMLRRLKIGDFKYPNKN